MLCLFLSLLLVACTAEEESMLQIKSENEVSDVLSSRISMKEASKRLSLILQEFTTTTRSGSLNIVGQGIALNRNQRPVTRAEEEDAWFYYFPIDGGERFAIMSARTDLPVLLAIGNEKPNWELLFGIRT